MNGEAIPLMVMSGPAGDPVLVLVLALIGVLILAGVFRLLYALFSLPLRRAERARLFLDVVEIGLEQGQGVEQTILGLSRMRELSLGVQFHLLAAHLEDGHRFQEALDRVPRFLSPQLAAMLRIGLKLGDLRKVLPACRRLLHDATSATQGAESYLLLFQSFLLPVFPVVFGILAIFVFPKILEIIRDMGAAPPALTQFVLAGTGAFMVPMLVLMLLVYYLVFLYVAGPGTTHGLRRLWGSLGDRLVLALPWRWKRLQRDFSSLLALLLDSGVPEAEAVALAAQATSNQVFIGRARQITEALGKGEKLTAAILRLDLSREFQWRLTNAVCARGGFTDALRGWHEALEAKAFQLEQAAAHGLTTGCILVQGTMVGVVVVAVFGWLIAIIEQGVLW